jgi:Penicillin binding protein transpeptidase domain
MASNLSAKRMLLPVVATLLILLPYGRSPALQSSSSLFAQTAQAILGRQFSSGAISYLLIDARSGEILAERWPQPEKPIPVGSLIKPFTALAYARTHESFPTTVCRGKPDACWLLHGHGRIELEMAVEQSCNAYFLTLARGLSVSQANAVLADYALPPVNGVNMIPALGGLSNDWQIAPLPLARAYAKLVREIRAGESREILYGMRQSARVGTARAISLALPDTSVLAKTGTAHCTHTPQSGADGFTVILFPADDPRLVLLTRVHGVTGAVAAATAGEMLRALDAGKP